MRTPNFLFIIVWSMIFLSPLTIIAQYSEKEIVTKGYTTDGIINILIDYTPAGWKFKEEKGYFIFQRVDSVMALTENTVNVPFEKKEDRMKRILANGRKTVSKILIRYEDKWDFIKIQDASLNNSSVYSEIRSLPEKYHISALKDIVLSSKDKAVYTPKTETDKKRILDYYKEREMLQSKIIKLPDFSSQKYSLFIISTTGCNDDNHLVYPDEASVELYGILNFLREVCGK